MIQIFKRQSNVKNRSVDFRKGETMIRHEEACFQRFIYILGMLSQYDQSYSIQEIADVLQIPAEVVREDICNLKQAANGIFGIEDEQETEEDASCSLDKLQKLDVQQKLWYEDTGMHFLGIPLSPVERIALQTWKNGKDKALLLPDIQVKKMLRHPLQMDANMKIIYDAIFYNRESGKKISFLQICYLTKSKEEKKYKVLPVQIITDPAQEKKYLIAQDEEEQTLTLRLDRICSCKEVKEIRPMPQIHNRIPKEQLWGMEAGEPIAVKLKIFDEGNVVEKVKRDLQIRTMGKWYQEGECFYYEDTVYGKNSFRSWINTYGSSVIVLEPKELAREILESAYQRLENYQEDEENGKNGE